MSPQEYFRVTDLHAFYGESHILHGMDFHVNRGECVAFLGRNGSGRTTTLRALMGLTGKRSGSIMVNGREAIGLAQHQIARLGVGYCPEERGIYASLSCEDNLLLPDHVAQVLGGADGASRMTERDIFGGYAHVQALELPMGNFKMTDD